MLSGMSSCSHYVNAAFKRNAFLEKIAVSSTSCPFKERREKLRIIAYNLVYPGQ